MKQYKLFFSWQNDRKDTKKVIQNALKNAQKQLKNKGIDLVIDQDTRSRVGKRNIAVEILNKINQCDIFMADLTPVITYTSDDNPKALPKHMPNSNVMYEYGYALRAKGENRMLVLASLDEDEHIEYMPFDINHDTITLFTDEESLRELPNWIYKILENVEKERAAQVPQQACTMQFQIDDESFDEITINPRYKRIWYTQKLPENKSQQMAAAIANPLSMQQQLIENMRRAQVLSVRPIHKTINYSFVPVKMVFMNTGLAALDNVKIRVTANDKRVSFADTNEKNSMPMISARSILSTLIEDDQILQDIPTINPSDALIFDEVYIHAPHDIDTFKLEWKVSSRTYQGHGELVVHVEPKYEYETIENNHLAGTERVEDYKESE